MFERINLRVNAELHKFASLEHHVHIFVAVFVFLSFQFILSNKSKKYCFQRFYIWKHNQKFFQSRQVTIILGVSVYSTKSYVNRIFSPTHLTLISLFIRLQ